MLSVAPVVALLEREADWQRHLQATCESLAPESHLELVLAERVALLLWRLARVARYEQHLLTQSQDDVERAICDRNMHQATLYPALSSLPYHPMDIRVAAEQTQALVDALAVIETLSDEAPISDTWAFALVCAAYDAAVPEQNVRIAVAGLPEQEEEEDQVEWVGRLTWTAGSARQAVATYAAHAGLSLADLLQRLRRDAEPAARGAAYRCETTEAAILRERENRLLPDLMHQVNLTRYETTLERQLSRTLDELEREQALRLRQGGNEEP